jgi:uncharacterized membrane-anchored protein
MRNVTQRHGNLHIIFQGRTIKGTELVAVVAVAAVVVIHKVLDNSNKASCEYRQTLNRHYEQYRKCTQILQENLCGYLTMLDSVAWMMGY